MTKDKKKKVNIWVKLILSTVLLVVLSVGGYSLTVYQNAKETVNEHLYHQVETIDREVVKTKVKAQQSLNVLLLGVDERSYDRGRSDAMMVLSLDPSEDKAQLISIPRDTRTEIVGRGTEDKINHAYAFGGPDMSIASVENLLDIELDYYVRVNMEGLAELVDAVGGITIENDIAFQDFQIGTLQLTGEEALSYVRMRKQDPRGDFGRTERQRKVIQGIIDQGATIGSVTKINDLLGVLGENVATNMDFDDMKNVMFNYKDTRKNFSTYQLQGSGTYIDGIYYMTVTDEEVEKVHNMIVKKTS
ncbi:LCP family protein [Aquibacillus koreensis]|uniref:LCP family protein n=1 Tax=Aquibacillus koreensis TaxID=279446 RepID=A0A9X3WRT4_9BACI|nr:LCP family protein [Aquibacillus koreensis]MCT2534189.1 LCP family protein [Aquibacillus koreensis]MDC3422581.1 LCP family protein [Aquibacillus koreensis]